MAASPDNPFSNVPIRILVFNKMRRLVAIFQSVTAAAPAFNVSPQAISYVCSGEGIRCKDFYFRRLMPDILVTMEDFGTLKLEEYDQLCGKEETRIIPVKRAKRKTKKIEQ